MISPKALREFCRSGGFAWPGGYPLALLMSDGEVLCAKCARANFRLIREAMDDHDTSSGWHPCTVFIHWEGEPLVCAHGGGFIEPAYVIEGERAVPTPPRDDAAPSCAIRSV